MLDVQHNLSSHKRTACVSAAFFSLSTFAVLLPVATLGFVRGKKTCCKAVPHLRYYLDSMPHMHIQCNKNRLSYFPRLANQD